MKPNVKYLIGIDEVGRGPLAGPVCVCSFIILKDNERRRSQIKNRRLTQMGTKNFSMSVFSGVRDSKKLSAKKREEWFEKIKELKKEGIVNYKIAWE